MSENSKMSAPISQPIVVIGQGETAHSIARDLSQAEVGCFISYNSARELLSRPPAGKVAMAILAAGDTPAQTADSLRWLRSRWPRTALTVIAPPGRSDCEQAAREGGALFFTQPVTADTWRDVISAVAHSQPQPSEAK